MSNFEQWWRANWEQICGTGKASYYFLSEKTSAEYGWKAAEEKTKVELDMLRSLIVEYIDGHHWSWEDKCELCKRAMDVLEDKP